MEIKILLQAKLKTIILILTVFVFLSIFSSSEIQSASVYFFEQKSNESISDRNEKHLKDVKSESLSSDFKDANVISGNVEINDGTQNSLAMDLEIPVKIFSAVVVDSDNNKWFLTEAGIVGFDGKRWTLHNKNSKVESLDIKGIAFEKNSDRQQIWLATPKGANVASLPIDAVSGATLYSSSNTSLISNNVLQISVGKSPLRWFGTDKGISAFKTDKWLTPDYEDIYPEFLFQEFPVLSMAADNDGDTLYIGTNGAGVARVFSNEVDGISGASVLAQWGPMILPSDKIYSIFIAPDGTRWFGTDMGVARHTGQNSLDNWTAFTNENGLVNNFVQAITADNKGKIWFGTKGGISVFDGSVWTSFTEKDGLGSNNILCIISDKNGVMWIGTDNGVTCFENGKFIKYQ
ncbi:MAG TPA: two-component regulator propeller domain-containing protein [Draconibacterium sp.]|nr:two-component regulator propeller domain-containing protein [Draconibacterium sp.]